MPVTGTVLYDHVVSIQAHDPTTNITLVNRIGFQPGKGTIIHTQLEVSNLQVGPVITANISAFGAPYFISVSLRTILL